MRASHQAAPIIDYRCNGLDTSILILLPSWLEEVKEERPPVAADGPCQDTFQKSRPTILELEAEGEKDANWKFKLENDMVNVETVRKNLLLGIMCIFPYISLLLGVFKMPGDEDSLSCL